MQRRSNRRVSTAHIALAICLLPLVGACLSPLRLDAPEPQDADLAEFSLEELLDLEFMLPIGVLGAHTHLEGEWMVGVSQMVMEMDTNYVGSNTVSDASVLGSYPVTPTDMRTETTMVNVMYAPSDDLTLMTMVPFIQKTMNHRTGGGMTFRTSSRGIGDVRFSGLYTFWREGAHRLHFDAGFSAPTGSIDERGNTPAMTNAKLPYPMQLGSGTFDLHPGLTYLGETDEWAWGAQAHAVIRLGENDNDYRLGNVYHVTSWATRRLTDALATSLRLDAHFWGNIKGADPELVPGMVPTADANLRGGKRVDLLWGLNLYGDEGTYEGQRLDFEYGIPVYQNLNGPQLGLESRYVLSWKVTF